MTILETPHPDCSLEELAENTATITGQGTENNALVPAMQSALRLFDVRLTVTEIINGMPNCPDDKSPKQQNEWAVIALQRRGVVATWQSISLDNVKPFLLPAIVRLETGFVVLTHYDEKTCRVIIPELGSSAVEICRDDFRASYPGEMLLLRPKSYMDHRADDLITVRDKHWFWHTLWGFKRYIFEAVALSVIINILALAMSIFTMTVYNRVLPNQTYVTLWTMAVGVSIALLFELIARLARAWIS